MDALLLYTAGAVLLWLITATEEEEEEVLCSCADEGDYYGVASQPQLDKARVTVVRVDLL